MSCASPERPVAMSAAAAGFVSARTEMTDAATALRAAGSGKLLAQFKAAVASVCAH